MPPFIELARKYLDMGDEQFVIEIEARSESLSQEEVILKRFDDWILKEYNVKNVDSGIIDTVIDVILENASHSAKTKLQTCKKEVFVKEIQERSNKVSSTHK
eukprot:TRINITY_DN14439_c0_g1_i1.p1 TRINITY_DN14439_c0_g1~~TRINITY_DN14439_c0_g1_i1.p1  ORF type:complete len:102 (-),score=15.93 TRINITY_DN14439_c0_g1_i1:206-511(-)